MLSGDFQRAKKQAIRGRDDVSLLALARNFPNLGSARELPKPEIAGKLSFPR